MPAKSQALSVWQAVALGLFVLLPFAADLAAGGTLYFRDLYRVFLPLRGYLLEGLARGELRYWNPLLHEGEPSTLLPLAYPFELLQLLAPSAAGISLFLVLHVSLAAVSFALLATALGRGRLGALTGAVIYAWGGLLLSTLNLYFYIYTVAWAPLLVWACLRAVEARGFGRVLPTLAVAVAISTQGLELLLQALLVGVLLARPRRPREALRLSACLLLGAGLCGYVLLPTLAALGGSPRGEGFEALQAVAFSLHPVGLLQTVVGNLHSDLQDPNNQFWGQRFFEGQTYFQSLYLGPLTLVLALFGLRGERGKLLAALCALGALLALGRHVRLDLLLELVPALRSVRFPVKAFFLVHICTALLAAGGIERLAAQSYRWRRAGAVWAAVAALLGLGALALLSDSAAGVGLARSLLMPGVTAGEVQHMAERLGQDLEQEAVLCLAAAALAAAAASGRLPARRAAALVAVLLAVDLLRTGANLNRMTPVDALTPAPEVRALAAELRSADARALVCEVDWRALQKAFRVPNFAWVAGIYVETLAPATNLIERVRTALGQNTTMHVPDDVCLTPRELLCRDLPRLTERLVAAGVTHVIATHPLAGERLRLLSTIRPPRIAPLEVLVYAFEQAPPFVDLQGPGRAQMEQRTAGHMRLRLTAERAAELVVHERWAPGWSASLDGAPTPLIAARRHLTVAVPAGAHDVSLDYRPPGLRAGVTLTLGSLALVLLAAAVEHRGLRRDHGRQGPGGTPSSALATL